MSANKNNGEKNALNAALSSFNNASVTSTQVKVARSHRHSRWLFNHSLTHSLTHSFTYVLVHSVTLQSVLKYCCSFDGFSEDVIECIKTKKNPAHARICMIQYVSNICTSIPEKLPSSHVKQLSEAILTCVEESDVQVREASCHALGLLLAIAKKRPAKCQFIFSFLNKK